MYQEPATRETPDLDPELDTADPGTLRLADRGGTGSKETYVLIVNSLSVCSSVYYIHQSMDEEAFCITHFSVSFYGFPFSL